MAGHEADAYPEIGTVISGTDPNGPDGQRLACFSKHVPDSGPILWADPALFADESAQKNDPATDRYQEGRQDAGPIGPIGPISGTTRYATHRSEGRHRAPALVGT